MLFAKIVECVEPEILEISVLAVNKLCYDGVELMRWSIKLEDVLIGRQNQSI